jgi:hypothetical protein
MYPNATAQFNLTRMKRRQFISRSTVGMAGALLVPSFLKGNSAFENADSEFPYFQMRKLTSGPKNHFFGYYGMSPWNRSESKMVCLESSFQNRMPEPGEKATIGLVDPETGTFSPISETEAWNLQQGSLLHWNPLNPEEEIIYNDRVGNDLGAVSLNVNTGKKNILPRSISAVSKKGKYALSLTYGRLSRMRKVVGYANAVDPYANEPHPKKDGVFLIDLEKGKSKLIVSLDEVYEMAVGEYPILKERDMWFNHTDFNPSGTRFLFLARTRGLKNKLDSSMFTVNIDGTDLRQVLPFGTGVSHFGWRNDEEIVATFKLPGEKVLKHMLFKDGETNFRVLGEDFIIDNGHCTFSPSGRWMATDRKEDHSRSQSLWLYDMELDKGTMLADLPVNEYNYLHSNTRCDFHPRWNLSGNKICFDAIDNSTGTRQMHVVEIFGI